MAVLSIKIDPHGAQQGAAAVRSALDSIKSKARETVGVFEDKFNGLKNTLFSVKTAIAGIVGGLAGREIVRAVTTLDAISSTLTAVAGDSKSAANELAFVRETANRLGLELESTARSYSLLAASAKGTALAGEETRRIFEALTEATTVLHLSGAQTEQIIRAVSQMMGKGVIASEELRLQLGDLLPGAIQIMARAIGVTTPELNKMLQSGELMAEHVLPKFAEELRRTFAAGVPDAINSTQAQINRFKTAILEIQDTIGRSGFVSGLTDGMQVLSRTLRDPAVERGLTMMGGLFGQIIRLVADLGERYAPALAEAFVQVFQSVLLGGARLLDTTAPLFRAIFAPIESAWETFQGLPPEIQTMGIIGALTLGTKGKLILLGTLATLDLVDKGVKKLSATILGVKEEDLGPSIFEENRQRFGQGLNLHLTGQEGSAEAAVKKAFQDIQSAATNKRPGLTGPAGPSLIQPSAPMQIKTKADEEFEKALLKLQLETDLAEKKLEMTQRTGANSQAMKVEARLLDITNDLTKEKVKLTDQQKATLRDLVEREVAAKTAAEQLAEAEKHHEEVLKSRMEVMKELDDEIETTKITMELAGKTRHEREVETRILEIQNRLKKQGAEFDGEDLARLREKVEEHEKLQEQMELMQTPLGAFARFGADIFGQLQLLGVRAFQSIEDQIVEAFKTGELSLQRFLQMLQEELLRISIRGFVTAPLANALNGVIGSGAGGLGPSSAGAIQTFGGSSGAGILSGIGGLFSGFSLFGGGSGAGIAAAASRGAANPALFGPGFQEGGAFVVPGIGGADSKQVAFRATPGERVTIETPAQQQAKGGGEHVINLTIVNQVQGTGGPGITPDAVVNIIDANMRNNGQVRRTIRRGGR